VKDVENELRTDLDENMIHCFRVEYEQFILLCRFSASLTVRCGAELEHTPRTPLNFIVLPSDGSQSSIPLTTEQEITNIQHTGVREVSVVCPCIIVEDFSENPLKYI
jgi:hypothetical protein